MHIAIIGSGISGLAAAWLLGSRHEVTLYEADHRLGGHTNTVDVTLDGISHPVDTGFLVFNRHTYPHLCALFAYLGVESVATDMSFAVSLTKPRLEWAGSNLATLFAQPANLARPGFWRMLQDILRFNRETAQIDGTAPEISLGVYLDARGYSREFRDWYLLPMAAAIWSCPAQQMLDYPLLSFVRFCRNHGLLQVFDRPQWQTVKGGARTYVQRMARDIADIRLATPISRVVRDDSGVLVQQAAGAERYDAVVFACHSDQTLKLLGEGASDEERRVLSAVTYQANRAVLHTDPALLPRRKAVWSAWNYMAGDVSAAGQGAVSVSYLLNRLQPLPFKQPVIVSLNPLREPAREQVIAEFDYGHPVFDVDSALAQSALAGVQGRRHAWFCGAWTGHGFHEDGLRSALVVANALGVQAPWQGAQESQDPFKAAA